MTHSALVSTSTLQLHQASLCLQRSQNHHLVSFYKYIDKNPPEAKLDLKSLG